MPPGGLPGPGGPQQGAAGVGLPVGWHQVQPLALQCSQGKTAVSPRQASCCSGPAAKWQLAGAACSTQSTTFGGQTTLSFIAKIWVEEVLHEPPIYPMQKLWKQSRGGSNMQATCSPQCSGQPRCFCQDKLLRDWQGWMHHCMLLTSLSPRPAPF